jgi:hypothetical protein
MTATPPSTPVDICNLALNLMGEGERISSIETPSYDNEVTMAAWYDQSREETLRSGVWNFCQKYQLLTRTEDGSFGYDDAYNLPNDCIRINVVGTDRYSKITDYEVSENQIHASNGTNLGLFYNKNTIAVSRMDPLFIKALALRLALNTAFLITKKKSIVEALAAALLQQEANAKSVDGMERPPRRIQRSRLISARRSGGLVNRDNRFYQDE